MSEHRRVSDDVVGIFETIGDVLRGRKSVEDLFNDAVDGDQGEEICTKTPHCSLAPKHEGECRSVPRRIK